MFATLASAWRLLHASVVLARHDALLPREYQERLPPAGRWVGRIARLIAARDRDQRPGVRLARALERLGPAYVKLGQLLSTRADLVGEVFARDLSALQDRMPAFPLEDACAVIENETGKPWQSLFACIEPAINAASVAQVHRAVTVDGEPRALKVLRPGVDRRISKDVRAMRLGARLAEGLVPRSRRLRPRAFVETVETALIRELDLRLEAASASEIADIAVGLEGFDTPLVDWARTGKRFLAMDWIDAIALTDEAALREVEIDRPVLARRVIEVFLTCALEHGVFHADMHEGNLYAEAPARLIAIDFGIVGRIGKAERRYLAEILYGFLRRDYDRIARVHFEAGYVPAHHSVQDFASALRAVGEPIFGRTADQVSMARVLLQLFDVTELFDMALRTELVLLQKTMVQAEGVARRLDPAFDMWGAAEPVVTRYVRRQLGPEGMAEELLTDARRLHGALRRLPDVIDRLAERPATPPSARYSGWVLAGVGIGALLIGLLLAG